jgi:hypothetical protein
MPPLANPPPSPFEWGRRERIQELLGDAFKLRFETGTTTLRMPDGESVWELFVNGFGPIKTIAANIDPGRREQLKRDLSSSTSGIAPTSGSRCRAITLSRSAIDGSHQVQEGMRELMDRTPPPTSPGARSSCRE